MGQWTGVIRRGAGWQAWVSVRRVRDTRTFPLETPPEEMQAWREQRRAELVLRVGAKPASGSFVHDALRYLQAVRAMPTYATRRQHILEWAQVFRTKPRAKITPSEIRARRDKLLTTPRAEGKPPYSASAVNQRLRALSNLWTVLDGRRAPNPVRDVPEAEERHRPPRALPYTLIEQILEALPDRGRAEAGETRPTASQTKARLLIMAWTGLPPKVIGTICPEDVDWSAGTVRVHGRGKGKGGKGAVLPLLPQAIAAFRLLDQAGGWPPLDEHGRPVPYSASSARQSFRRACARVKRDLVSAGVPASQTAILDDLTPYDLRHSFLTHALRQSGDLRGVSRLALHADLRTTMVYTEAAVDPLAAAVLSTFRQSAVQQGGTSEAKPKPVKRRKANQRKKIHRTRP